MMGMGLALSTSQNSVALPAPLTIASLVAWYRADKGITIATGVSQWNDQSGTGDANKNAIQATGANQPTLNASDVNYGGQATITSVAADRLVTGVWAVALAQPFTVFWAGHRTGGSFPRFFDSLSSLNLTGCYDDGGNATAQTVGLSLAAGTTTANTPSISYVIFNGASSKIGVRQRTPNATGALDANGATGLTLGGSQTAATNGMIGTYAEFVVLAEAATAAHIDKIMSYMGALYGLAVGA